MKNKIAIILSLLILAFAAQTFAIGNSADKLRIVKVSSAALSSEETEVPVEVEYNFDSGEDGIITIGFNSEKDSSFTMQPPLSVKKGKNTITLKATVKPADWKKNELKVLAILTATPTGDSFIPSASDTKTYKFDKK